MPLTGYDEVWDEAGRPRPAVAAFEARTGVSVTAPGRTCVEALGPGDGVPVLPVPLVLADAEYVEVIAAGVRQRARALRALFHDLFAGPRRVVGAGVIDESLVDAMVGRAGWTDGRLRHRWGGAAPPDVRFVYGPDLMRGPDGRWVVVEDNVGCVGGMVDATLVVARYLHAAGINLHPGVPRPDDLGDAVAAFLRSVGAAADDPGVVATAGRPAPCGTYDETGRKAEVLTRLGLRVLDRDGLEARLAAGAPPTAVVDLGTGVDEGRAPMLGGPGTGLLGDKALLPIMDEVTRALLDEEPILATPPTAVVDRMPDRPDGVLKRVDGCGGTDVHFLADHGVDGPGFVADRLAAWGPRRAVLQELVEASTLPTGGPGADCRHRVELRPIAYLVGDDVRVGEVPAGRAAPVTGDRRGNITTGASYVPVVREPVG